uniref:Uncharacterized protein n=1 Tax=Anguilla anguilla TaxID=7936 RepID=A0A0E9V9E5_ANGAN
MLTFMISFSEN